MEKDGQQMFKISPTNSSINSVEGSTARNILSNGKNHRYYRPFKSSKVPEDFSIPLYPRTKAEIFARRLPWIASVLGVLMVVAGAYWGYSLVPKYTYSQVIWYEDFTGANYNFLDDFNREVAFDGFGQQFLQILLKTFTNEAGAGSSEFNTDYDNNSFVENGRLHIRPLMTDPYFNTDGVVVNLTAEGRCTEAYTESACVATRNSSRGSYFNPVTSARLNTQNKHTMRYGRIEVNAKTPLGNWLWPAIWMLPQNTSTYGIWPASGEIDMVEARGNKPGYPGGGYDEIQTSIHMAPVGGGVDASDGKGANPIVPVPLSDLPREFHTYGMDWTPQSIRIWVDNPIYATLDWKFKTNPYENFDLPAYDEYGNAYADPWSVTNHKSAPFDQDFYLILNVAAASGYFSQVVDVSIPLTVRSIKMLMEFRCRMQSMQRRGSDISRFGRPRKNLTIPGTRHTVTWRSIGSA